MNSIVTLLNFYCFKTIFSLAKTVPKEHNLTKLQVCFQSHDSVKETNKTLIRLKLLN